MFFSHNSKLAYNFESLSLKPMHGLGVVYLPFLALVPLTNPTRKNFVVSRKINMENVMFVGETLRKTLVIIGVAINKI